MRWPWRRAATGNAAGRAGARMALWRVRAAALLLWVLVVGGAAAGVAALAADRAPAPPTPVQLPDRPAGVGDWAELFVATWLAAGEGDTERLEMFTGTQADLQAGREQLYPARTATVGVDDAGAGAWTVTVAADLLRAHAGGWEPAGLRFYEVGVVEADGQLAATGLPGQVAAPPPPAGLRDVTGRPAPDDDAQQTAGRFLAALLAGQGEVDRYAAPGMAVRPVRPPPYAAVELAAIADLETAAGRLLTVEAVAETADGAAQRLGYWLRLARRDGRWEVAGFGGGASPPGQGRG